MSETERGRAVLRVVHYQRKPCGTFFSVERVFEAIRRSLPSEVAAEAWVCRFQSQGVARRLFNLLEAPFHQGDINHITGDVHYLALLLRKKRTVLTILDCRSMLRLRGARRLLFQWIWLKLPVRRCSVVSVISEHTRREVLRYTSCRESKTRVVPVPVGNDFRPAPKAFNADGPRILQVGTEDNKNLARVAAALSGIRCRLDIVGPLSADAKRTLEDSGIEYEWAAGLSDAELAAKYRDADLLAFCSTYEGFGMPILEAQATGRPVVTSNIEPMSEVAGSAACLVDPFDCSSIRQGVLRVINEPEYRNHLIAQGFENVKRFRADTIAAQYAALYREVLSRS